VARGPGRPAASAVIKIKCQALHRAAGHDNNRIRHAFFFHQAMDMRDEHDTVAGGDAKERDEADDGGDRQNPAREKYPDTPPISASGRLPD